jgi:hypothetical protein
MQLLFEPLQGCGFCNGICPGLVRAPIGSWGDANFIQGRDCHASTSIQFSINVDRINAA